MAYASVQQQRAKGIAYKNVPAFRYSTPPKQYPQEALSAPATEILVGEGQEHIVKSPPEKENDMVDADFRFPRGSDRRRLWGIRGAPPKKESGEQLASWELDVAQYETARGIEETEEAVLGVAASAQSEKHLTSPVAHDAAHGLTLAAPVEPAEPAEPAQMISVSPHSDVLRHLVQAFDDETIAEDSFCDRAGDGSATSGTGFRWTSVMDAAHAAWIGGTQLLRYGELLPGGAEKAIACMLAGNEGSVAADSAPALISSVASGPFSTCRQQLALELGMGRGRLALQLFLNGATVIGCELAAERYGIALSALERLVHRSPQQFEISKRASDTLRIRRRGGPRGAIFEVRQGDFFDKVPEEEVRAATMIFCQVCLPPPVWPRIQQVLANAKVGCRVLMYEDLKEIWEGGNCPFRHLGSPRLSCSWAARKGRRFHLYERIAIAPASESVLAVHMKSTTPSNGDLTTLQPSSDSGAEAVVAEVRASAGLLHSPHPAETARPCR